LAAVDRGSGSTDAHVRVDRSPRCARPQRARPLPLEALVETLAGHVVIGLETLDVRAQEFSAQDGRLDHVEPARGESLLDRALDEEREVVQLLVRARATGSEGVRVEVFQLLDVDARVALLALLGLFVVCATACTLDSGGGRRAALTEEDAGGLASFDEPPPERVAPPLTGARGEALDRMDAVIVRLGVRSDDLDAANESRGAYAFDTLGESELTGWFSDQRLVAGEDAATGLGRTLDLVGAEIALVSSQGRPALGPLADQELALAELHRTALGMVETSWNAVGGSVRRVSGPLFVARDRSAPEVADDFLAEHWGLLARLIAADAGDSLARLEPLVPPYAPSEPRPPYGVVEHVGYRRVRHGEPFPQNFIDVHVTNERHPYGTGVVLGVRIEWDRVVLDRPSGTTTITRDRALAIASDALRTDVTRHGFAVASHGLQCRDQLGGARWCGHAWRVGWVARDSDTPRGTLDTVYIDAPTGEVVATAEERDHYTGSINITSNYPGDVADQFRDNPYGQLMAVTPDPDEFHQTDRTGTYNWTPSAGTTAFVRLHSNLPFPNIFHHEFGRPFCTYLGDPAMREFPLGGVANLTFAPEPLYSARADRLAWSWFWYLNEMVMFDFLPLTAADLPVTLWYDAFSGEGGQAAMCDPYADIYQLSFGAHDDSVAETPAFRAVAGHEYFHVLQKATAIWGPGGADALSGANAPPFANEWNEGTADTFGAWFNRYQMDIFGGGAYGYQRYRGEGAVGDLMLDDDEIDGTPTDADGCNLTDDYDCTAQEACWFSPSSHDRPRCMRRAVVPEDELSCFNMFGGNQPGVRQQPWGQDNEGTDEISICVHDDYVNGRVFQVLGSQLFQTAGYAGVAAMTGTNKAISVSRLFTCPVPGCDSYHEEMRDFAGDYEATDAFHTVSTETFPWLDDTTDRRERAELVRISRGQLLTYASGGPTGTALAFQKQGDVDWFLTAAGQSSSFTVASITASSSVDLCIQVYNWTTGGLIATAAGCSDGVGNRNATVTFSTGAVERFAVRVSNALVLAGPYDLRLLHGGDDYPNTLASALTAQPLRPASSLVATLASASDAELFRYDRPPGQNGQIQLTISPGPTPAPTIEVYPTNGTSAPTGSPTWTGSGSVTVPSPTSADHYWVRVVSTGGTGFYTLGVNHTGCGATCSPSGSRLSPRPLPVLNGGFVWNALTTGSGSDETPVLTDCQTGVTCDWYGVTLAANERLTATIYNVSSQFCNLQLEVYGSIPYYSAVPSPIVRDRNGSMETLGAQLTFVAPFAANYQIAVRGTGTSGCSSYELGVTRGAFDTFVPQPYH
jgi:hypothetical protein